MEALAEFLEGKPAAKIAEERGIRRQWVYDLERQAREKAATWDEDTEAIYSARKRIGKRLRSEDRNRPAKPRGGESV